jgi:tripartite ATP-independent transporter DctM subunit
MGWVELVIIGFGILLVCFAVGMPVAFAFLIINVVGAWVFWNGAAGLNQLVLSVMESVTHFGLLPVPLFIIMGEVLFRSGIASKLMDVLASWIGRVPGRLSLMAVGGGTLFATLTGSGMAGTAMLGKILVPEMEKHGYKKPMSLGPILGSGGLAIMIPPTALGVLLAALANISIGDFLVAIVVPGLLMAVIIALYVVIRCTLQPDLAPLYDVPPQPLGTKIKNTAIYVFPMLVIVFLVVGLVFLGIATATEAAALGALGSFVLAYLYKGLNWAIVAQTLKSTLGTSCMFLMILTGSTAFSQLMAFTGATGGLASLATSYDISPIWVVIAMQVILLILGCFMEPLSIMMLTVPIYFPVIEQFGFNPIWFGAIMLLNMEMATISPPFGLSLFVMKGVAPPGTTMGDVYRAAIPFFCCHGLAMVLMIIFPDIVLWLPGQMER